MKASNYPDDIRSFDSTPGSPYYSPPWEECTLCGNLADPEKMDDDGRCPSCEVVICPTCEDDIASCGGCLADSPNLLRNQAE